MTQAELDLRALRDCAAATIAAFRPYMDAGTLRSAEHSSLLMLESAILPFADLGSVAAGAAASGDVRSFEDLAARMKAQP